MDGEARIHLAHGGGGRLSRDLIDEEIVSRFGDGPLAGLPDGAELEIATDRIIFSTDGFVVQPLEFPGGNIGDLAVHGTVNDIAVAGGRPRWLSVALIIEEGLLLATLRRVLDSLKAAALDCGVQVVTGDTKVVAKGQCDGLYITSAGIGERIPEFSLSPQRVEPGDHVLLSGPIGDHGMAVLTRREGIQIEHGPQSDTGPVHRLVAALSDLGPAIRFMRDPTRGGVAAVLNEIVEDRPVGMLVRSQDIPLSTGTKAVSEMLGLDPLQVASEGRAIAICSAEAAPAVLERWQALPEGSGARDIGEITTDGGRVVMQTITGGHRLLDVPRGELLPRIC